MKTFIKFTKIVAYICTSFLILLFVTMCIDEFKLVAANYKPSSAIPNIFYMFVILPTTIASIVGPIILLVLLLIFVPMIFKYINKLEQNPSLCDKKEMIKILLILIIIVLFISIIAVLLINMAKL